MTNVPVLYLPGSLCDERVFADQLRDIDHPSQVADLTLDDTFAAMAARALRQAPDRFAIVGLSMGCIVAAEMAEVAPDRVAGLALFDFNLDAPGEEQNRTRRRWASDVRAGHFDRVIEEIAPAMTVSPDSNGALFVAMARAVGPGGFFRQNDALLVRHDRRPIVTNFAGPTLIGCGRHDPLCPPELHTELAAAVPDAQLMIAEQAGHLSTIDEPARLTSAIQGWLQMCNNHLSLSRRGNHYEHHNT